MRHTKVKNLCSAMDKFKLRRSSHGIAPYQHRYSKTELA